MLTMQSRSSVCYDWSHKQLAWKDDMMTIKAIDLKLLVIVLK